MKKNRHLLSLILFLLLTLSFLFNITVTASGAWQEGDIAAPILERNVTIRVVNIPLGDVLKDMSTQAGFYFSYSAHIFNPDKKVSLSVESEKVRAVLTNLLGNNFQFKEKGNYLIIQKLKADEQLIGGYISDKKTGKKLSNVTVYDKKTLASATTDSAGYYEIITRKPIQQLSIARYNYGDTVLQVRSEKANPQNIDVSLLPKMEVESREIQANSGEIVEKSPKTEDFTEQTLISNLQINQAIRRTVSEIQRINELNIQEPLSRKWQASLAPYVGTNLGLSGNVVNDWSFNATVGYSKGNNKMEVAGIGNISQGDVKGVQLATIFNIVKGNMKGIQASMILNRTRKVSGLQAAGITNYTDTILRGLQFSGINNYAELGGKGVFQIAGMYNKTAEGRTFFQAAAVGNKADTVGFQIGLINNANRLRGLQIGLINRADTADGVLLGLINIVKKGYHVLEISSNDVTYGNISFRTGTRWFYTIYALGGQPKIGEKPNILSGGMGLGTSIWFGKTVVLTLDATAHRYWLDPLFENRGGLVRLAPALNLQITKRFGIGFAPTWNIYFLNSKNQTEGDVALIKKNLIPEKAQLSGDKYEWWGWSVGLRFF